MSSRRVSYNYGVRLIVCVDEVACDWWETKHAVLRALNETQPSERHLLLRNGSLIDWRNHYRKDWFHDASHPDDRHNLAIAMGETRVGAFAIEGIPMVGLVPFLDRVRELDHYLGFVEFTREPLIGVIVEHSLPYAYRVVGSQVRVLHQARELLDDLDEPEYQAEELRKAGVFDEVVLEDIGVRDTLFDPAGTDPQRALRVGEAIALARNPDHAEGALMWVDVIDFHLADALHAAVERVATARTPEAAAQAALSARRFLQQLADVLFLPQDELRNGRLVRAEDWKNRLWAGLDEASPGRSELPVFIELGQLFDQLAAAADIGVHRLPAISIDDVVALIDELLEWVYRVSLWAPPPSKSDLSPFIDGITEVTTMMINRLRAED